MDKFNVGQVKPVSLQSLRAKQGVKTIDVSILLDKLSPFRYKVYEQNKA